MDKPQSSRWPPGGRGPLLVAGLPALQRVDPMLGGLVTVPQPVVKAGNETKGARAQRRRSLSNTCKKKKTGKRIPVTAAKFFTMPPALILQPPTGAVRKADLPRLRLSAASVSAAIIQNRGRRFVWLDASV